MKVERPLVTWRSHGEPWPCRKQLRGRLQIPKKTVFGWLQGDVWQWGTVIPCSNYARNLQMPRRRLAFRNFFFFKSPSIYFSDFTKKTQELSSPSSLVGQCSLCQGSWLSLNTEVWIAPFLGICILKKKNPVLLFYFCYSHKYPDKKQQGKGYNAKLRPIILEKSRQDSSK